MTGASGVTGATSLDMMSSDPCMTVDHGQYGHVGQQDNLIGYNIITSLYDRGNRSQWGNLIGYDSKLSRLHLLPRSYRGDIIANEVAHLPMSYGSQLMSYPTKLPLLCL